MEEIQAAPAEQEAGSEGEEDLDALYELLGKQGLNPSQQRKRKRKAQGGGTAPEDSAGFLNSYRARMQHVSNLVAAMRHHDSVGDDASLAHVLTTLMQATDASGLQLTWQFNRKPAHAMMAETLVTGYHLLRRHPRVAGYETLKRYLRRARQYQVTPAGKPAMTLMLARLMLDHGDAADAADTLASLVQDESIRNDVAFEARLLLGSIRHHQWGEAMAASAVAGRAPASQQTASQQTASQQTASQRALGALQPWNPYSHSAALWARAGRAAQEFAKEAAAHLKQAAGLQPRATHVCLMRVQLALAQGKTADALQLARTQVQGAPHDADAQALCLLLLLSKQALDAAAAGEAADRACSLLQCDPASTEAVQVLVGLMEAHPDLAPLPVLRAVCLHLDTTAPGLAAAGVTLQAWQLVDRMLRDLAAAVVQLHDALVHAKQEVAALRVPQEQPRREQLLDAAAREMQGVSLRLEAASGQWQAACGVLEQREWWWEGWLHLASDAAHMCHLLQEGRADAATLAAQAMVHAVQHAALERQRLRALQQGRTAAPSPAAAAAPAVVEALRQARAPLLADQLTAGLAAVQGATAALSSQQQQQAGVGAAFTGWAATAQQFGEQTGRPWQPVAGWAPIPPGTFHPHLGPIAQLPQPWWVVFPWVRRREEAARVATAQQGEQAERQPGNSHLETGERREGHRANGGGGHPGQLGSPAEGVGSQPTQRSQRRVRFVLPPAHPSSTEPD